MDITPPPHQSDPRTRPKSASRLSNLRHYSEEPIPKLCLQTDPSSPKLSSLSPSPSNNLPIRELLLLSPSPMKRSKKRLSDRIEIAANGGTDTTFVEPSGVRKKCKVKNVASPRSNRKSRRKSREEMEIGLGEEAVVKPRKKRQSGRGKKEKSIGDNPVSEMLIDGEKDVCTFDRVEEIMTDLVMWKDVSKSSLWFGFGSLSFLSSCFAKGVNFSIFSFLSQVGLLCLGVSFLKAMRQRDENDTKREFKLKEEDILKLGRLVLPTANFVISKTREIFSGEPAMTLKVVPFLLLGAEYGHLITLWRLCALSFFISFTGPKLYSAYSAQLSKKVEHVISLGTDAWGNCTHKKIVSASIVTAFWNLTAIKTRIFAAFLCLVIFRYRRQNSEAKFEDGNTIIPEEQQEKKKEKQQNKALVCVETESQK